MKELQEIFDKIKGRDWNWFGVKVKPVNYTIEDNGIYSINLAKHHSLADLLANKSWCKAVWGTPKNLDNWRYESQLTFQILQQKGEQEAIDYILKTMV